MKPADTKSPPSPISVGGGSKNLSFAQVPVSTRPSLARLLVVDDDPIVREQLQLFYTQSGYEVIVVGSAENALEHFGADAVDLLITDLKLPGMDGSELVSKVHATYPDVPIIAITGYSDIQTAVNVLKLGASDLIVKPFNLAAVLEATRVVLERNQVYLDIRQLRRSLENGSVFSGMLSKTAEMHRVFEIIRVVGPTDMTVLVQGETGTGKELVASAIHYQSQRRGAPFVTINCAGFPETLLESELFGYEKGAFTGADHAKAGKIELAHGGTLFLDEIESMSMAMQGKLLRVLEDQKVQRLGSRTSIQVDMRIVAATNVPLEELVAAGKMRSDFYFRINVIPLQLTPLRQRKVDIPLLVHDFIQRHPVAVTKRINSVSNAVMSALIAHSWPGNIRELQNVLERAIVLTRGREITEVSLPSTLAHPQTVNAPDVLPLDEWMRQQEKRYLSEQLESFGGNVSLTARICGIGLRTLSRKLQLHGLDHREFRKKKRQSTALFVVSR
jgi:DNA-binding NtrC family response regulator